MHFLSVHPSIFEWPSAQFLAESCSLQPWQERPPFRVSWEEVTMTVDPGNRGCSQARKGHPWRGVEPPVLSSRDLPGLRSVWASALPVRLTV